MTFDCSAGSAFCIGGHLNVVIIDSFESSDEVLITFLTSRRPHKDETVILTPEDHKWIRHDTIVSYADIRPMKREHLLSCIRDKLFQEKGKFTSEATKRIQSGILVSPRTKLKYKRAYTAYLNSQKQL